MNIPRISFWQRRIRAALKIFQPSAFAAASQSVRRVRRPGALAIAGIALLGAGPALAQSDVPVLRGAEQSAPVLPSVFAGDLRKLPRARRWQSGDPIVVRPRLTHGRGAGRSPRPGSVGEAPALPAAEPGAATVRSFLAPVVNIDGHSFTGAFPPDTVGDVGPNHYIQMVNDGAGGSSFAIYDKSGNVVVGPTGLDTLWTAGGQCANGRGDPIVIYDGFADRWLMSEFAAFGNHLCVYVSQTPDPVAGGWFLYDFPVPQFPDYPKYAAWPDAYYVSANESSPSAYALDRTRMLFGLPAAVQRFTAPNLAGFGFQALLPSDLDGAAPPPAGAPNFFMRHRDDEVHNFFNDPTRDFLEIFEFHVDFNNPGNSTFIGPTNIAVSEFDSALCGLFSFSCFPQPGTAQTLDPLREVIMWRLQYRNFGSHESLVGNFVTDVDGNDHGGIRWFELRRSGASAWSLFQEGTHAPDAAHRWMGSIAMDRAGDIALGYSVSSDTVFPSIRYAGRLQADPAGTLPQGEGSILAGQFSQTGVERWGDYASMNVDPVDDCTFWYTNEYVQAGGTWRTRIASFAFPDCEVAGGLQTGMTPAFEFVICDNLTTAQSVSTVRNDTRGWDCEAEGLVVNSGDLLREIVIGFDDGGPAKLGGTLSGVDLTDPSFPLMFFLCFDQNTGQTVSGFELDSTTWDCDAQGLATSPGDVIWHVVFGVAE
jgi:hypothetical protein